MVRYTEAHGRTRSARAFCSRKIAPCAEVCTEASRGWRGALDRGCGTRRVPRNGSLCAAHDRRIAAPTAACRRGKRGREPGFFQPAAPRLEARTRQPRRDRLRVEAQHPGGLHNRQALAIQMRIALRQLRTRTPRTFPRSSRASAKSGFPPSPPHCAASTRRRLMTNALPVRLRRRRGPIAWHKPCWARQARFLNHMQRMYPAKFPSNLELHPNHPGCVKKLTGQISIRCWLLRTTRWLLNWRLKWQ